MTYSNFFLLHPFQFIIIQSYGAIIWVKDRMVKLQINTVALAHVALWVLRSPPPSPGQSLFYHILYHQSPPIHEQCDITDCSTCYHNLGHHLGHCLWPTTWRDSEKAIVLFTFDCLLLFYDDISARRVRVSDRHPVTPFWTKWQFFIKMCMNANPPFVISNSLPKWASWELLGW